MGLFLGLNMSIFENLFNRLMEHEGGYVNHPSDPGGETMWGVTKRVARQYGYTGSMRNLPKATAQAIADKNYWQVVRGDDLPNDVAWQVFDAAYNHGNRQAIKFLQRAVGLTGDDVDGIIGNQTLDAVKCMDSDRIVMLFIAERLQFFTNLRTWNTFGKGWSRRIVGNLRWAAKDN